VISAYLGLSEAAILDVEELKTQLTMNLKVMSTRCRELVLRPCAHASAALRHKVMALNFLQCLEPEGVPGLTLASNSHLKNQIDFLTSYPFSISQSLYIDHHPHQQIEYFCLRIRTSNATGEYRDREDYKALLCAYNRQPG
jgi:hypothetical protein